MCACVIYMVICASVFAENWGRFHSPLVPLAWFSMSRLPKHFCAHWSQHLPCRCFSLFIAPEWYSGAFSWKSTFLKISLLFIFSLPSPIPPTDDRENSEGTPTQLPASKKALFLRLLPKKVDFVPKKGDSHPKKVDSFPKNVSFVCLLIPHHIRVFFTSHSKL